jgi:hypothetical protein
MSGSTKSSTATPSKEDLALMIQSLQTENTALKAAQANPPSNKEPLKVPPPTKFTGKPGTLRTFLTQARLYRKFQSNALPYQSDQVLAISSYLAEDAAAWFEPILREYLEKGTVAKCTKPARDIFGDYDKFENAIKENFENPDEDRDYERQLLSLHQSGSTRDYAAKFRLLASHLEWDDEPLQVQFYKGLKDGVKDELIKEDRPNTLSTYMERAIRIDNRLYERRMEQRNKGWVGVKRPNGNNKKRTNMYGDPMELDAAVVKKNQETRECFNCRKKGHIAKHCRQPKKPHQPVPTPKKAQLNAAQRQEEVPHASLHWTACYQDNCSIHRSEKEGSGHLPKQPKTRRVAVLTRAPLPDNLAPRGPITNISIAGVTPAQMTYQVSIGFTSLLLTEDNPQMNPNHANHANMAWQACIADTCQEHIAAKIGGGFVPRRAEPGVPILRPYQKKDLEHWVKTRHDTPETAIFILDPQKPPECLAKERTVYDCPDKKCKVHMEEKAVKWHHFRSSKEAKARKTQASDRWAGHDASLMTQAPPGRYDKNQKREWTSAKPNYVQDTQEKDQAQTFGQALEESYLRSLEGKSAELFEKVWKHEYPHLRRSQAKEAIDGQLGAWEKKLQTQYEQWKEDEVKNASAKNKEPQQPAQMEAKWARWEAEEAEELRAQENLEKFNRIIGPLRQARKKIQNHNNETVPPRELDELFKRIDEQYKELHKRGTGPTEAELQEMAEQAVTDYQTKNAQDLE